ncbi:hypothetical protein Tco_0584180 [Tanacetum coccineum]
MDHAIIPEDPYAYIVAAYQAPPSPDYMPGPRSRSHHPHWTLFLSRCTLSTCHWRMRYSRPRSSTHASASQSPLQDDDDEEEEEEPSEDDVDDEDEDEEEEEEHPALANSVPPVHRMTTMISIRDEPSISLPPREEVERLLALTTLSLTYPTLLHYHLPIPQIPISPTSSITDPPPASVLPSHYLLEDRLLGLPYHLIRGKFYSGLVMRLERFHLPAGPQQDSIGGRRATMGFVVLWIYRDQRHNRAEEVGFGIRDVWVDLREAVEEVAPMTLEGVNTRVTELAAVQEQDTQDIYAVIGDTQDTVNQIYQRVGHYVNDSHYHIKTARLLDQEALVSSREAWGRSIELCLWHVQIMALTLYSNGQIAEVSLCQTLTMMQSLHGTRLTTLPGTEVTALQGQQGPFGGPAQPVAPEEAGSSS